MSINPVSFGRTVKVNAPLKVAKQAAKLINMDKKVVGSKDEKNVQKKLIVLFDDSTQGAAQAVSVNGYSYLVTGEESQRVADLKFDRSIQLDAAKKLYGNGEMYDIVKSAEDDRYDDLLKGIIYETEEPVSLSFKYSKASHRSKAKVKLNSMNVIL